MTLTSDYQSVLRRTSPAGTSAILKTGEKTLAAGILRAGIRAGILEFEARNRWHLEIRLESATILGVIGTSRNEEFVLPKGPVWSETLKCWELHTESE